MTDPAATTDPTLDPVAIDDASTAPAEPSPTAPAAPAGSHTRRHFIRGVAATGATTAAAVALDSAGVTHLLGESAAARGKTTPFSEFTAIAASSSDQVEVPEGFRADVLISWGDEFANTDGTAYTFGYNNDYLAAMPLQGKKDEALLFANHEYPDPFFQHGNVDGAAKTAEQIAIEKESVGITVVHIRRKKGIWEVVSPSPYNRRITGDSPLCDMTGPVAGTSQLNPTAVGGSAIIETTAAGSLANCSGGITPWGTVLSCEENYQGYDSAAGYGWLGAGNEKYNIKTYAHYGWVVEVDPYDPSSTPRKHTALGRFRHENTAFNAQPGKAFVLYMGDDKVNEGVYKFVSDREFLPGRRAHNLKILEEGTLYIAKWAPESRRRFAADGDVNPISATSGTGEWVEVLDSELVDTAGHLRERFGAEAYTQYFATNRPEDVEVDPTDGTVYIAFTNNSTVKDRHGCVRKLVEDGRDPLATTFTWADFNNGGPTGRAGAGEQGVSCADNLAFDQNNDLWVVTDISSSSLKGSTSPAPYYEYHGNNALFMVPRSGPNAGIAFRFANMPIEAEGTGPYFSEDFSTLFLAVQHPGEETSARGGVYGDTATYTSWWPDGNRTAGFGAAKPRGTTIAITRVGAAGKGSTVLPVPPGAEPAEPTIDVPEKLALSAFLSRGARPVITVEEPTKIDVRLRITMPRLGWVSSFSVTVAAVQKTVPAGDHPVTLKAGTFTKLAMKRRSGKTFGAEVVLVARPAEGGPSTTVKAPFTIK